MNLLTLKNNKKNIFRIAIFLGLLLIVFLESNKPEDDNSSSGSFINFRGLIAINNVQNVENYKYRLNNRKTRSINEVALKDLNYHFIEEVVFLEKNELPQGLCITEDYIIISSYYESDKKLGKLKVYSKENGNHLISLGVDGKSHLGGITFDGKYIWICNSDKMTLERISYEIVKELIVEHRGKTIDVREHIDMYHVNNRPSCVTYYNGLLYVTSHTIMNSGKMIGYIYDDKIDNLEEVVCLEVPPKVQGVAFTEQGEVVLSVSYGRIRSSYVKVYQSLQMMNHDINNYQKCIELPPCSEGIFYCDDKIYIIFESAATKYFEGTDGKGKSNSPIDKILVIEKMK